MTISLIQQRIDRMRKVLGGVNAERDNRTHVVHHESVLEKRITLAEVESQKKKYFAEIICIDALFLPFFLFCKVIHFHIYLYLY